MLQRDFSAGSMEQTGNPLDFAIEGEGFFAVQTAAGEAFTRDGRFSLNTQGQIVTRNGDLVMGDGGPITLNPSGGAISVSREGTISQDGATAGTLRVSNFPTPAALERVGNNLWRATDEPAQPATGACRLGLRRRLERQCGAGTDRDDRDQPHLHIRRQDDRTVGRTSRRFHR